SLAIAQSYSIPSCVMAAGASTCANGQYALSGTIGQPDAGVLSHGSYTLSGGFWTFEAVPTPGAPQLSIVRTGTNTVVVSWTSPSTGFHLEQTSDLATASWVAPLDPVLDNGIERFIIVNRPTGNRFYRLKSP